MNGLKRQRAWRRFLEDVHRGLEAAGLDTDFFSVDDLRHLAAGRNTAQQVVACAIKAIQITSKP